jgi:hypothetical protein
MPEHFPPYENDALVNLETHHEKSDVNVRALLIFLIVFILFAIVTHILLYFMFQFFVRIENGRTNAPLTMIQRPPNANVPEQPRLQPFPNRNPDGQVIVPNTNTPVTDMEEMRANEERAQTTYGWIDPQKGTVRIPIEEAKRLLLQRGVTVVAPPASAVTAAPAGPANAPRTPVAPATEGDSNPARIGTPAGTATSTASAGTPPSATPNGSSNGGARP